MLDIAAGCDSKYIGMGALIGSLPQRGLEALYTMGPDGELNPTARWYDRAMNLAGYSADLTNALWTKTNTTADSATLLTFDAQNGLLSQSVTTLDATNYTLSFKARRITGNTALKFYHNDSETGNTSALTLTATLTRYSVTILGKNGGGAVLFGVQDVNAAGHGQIEITEIQVTPGSSAGTYRATEARQRVWDWSPGANHAQVGSAGGSDTNDPGDAVWRKNLLADGSTEDLNNAAWNPTDVTVDTATTMTFDAQNGQVWQGVTTVAGVTYTVSFEARRITGNTGLRIRHFNSATGDSTNFTITDTLTRHSVSVLGKAGDGVVGFGIRDANVVGHGQIEVTEWQVEVGALSDYDASDRQIVAARGDFDGVDDYDVSPNLPGFDYSQTASLTIFALFRADVLAGLMTIAGLANTTDNDQIELELDTTGVSVKSRDDSGTNNSTRELVSARTWYIAGLIQSGGIARLFLNGSATERTISVKDPDQTPRVGMGAFVRGGPADFFNGEISLVAVYSRALSAGEVLGFYNTVKKYWNLDSLNARRNLTLP